MISRNFKNVLVVSIGFLSLFTAYGGLQSLQVGGRFTIYCLLRREKRSDFSFHSWKDQGIIYFTSFPYVNNYRSCLSVSAGFHSIIIGASKNVFILTDYEMLNTYSQQMMPVIHSGLICYFLDYYITTEQYNGTNKYKYWYNINGAHSMLIIVVFFLFPVKLHTLHMYD